MKKDLLNVLLAGEIMGAGLPNIAGGSQIPLHRGVTLKSSIYAKRKKRLQMAKKSKSINRKK